MAIARVRFAENATLGTATTSFALSWGTAPASGNYGVLLLGVNENGSRRTITTPTGWTLLETVENGGLHQEVDIYGRELDGTANDTPTVVVGTGTATNMVAYLIEYSGVADASPLDVTAESFNDTAGFTFTTGTTAATTQADALAVGMFGWKNNGTVNTPTNSFTLVDQSEGGASNDNMSAAWVEKILSATGTQECSVTAGLSRRYAAAIVVLKAAAAADATAPTVTIDTIHGTGVLDDVYRASGYDSGTDVLTVTGTAADTGGSGLAGVEVRVDGGAWVAATGTTTWSIALDVSAWAAGTHLIEARATDVATNVSTTASETVWHSPDGTYGAAAVAGQHLVPLTVEGYTPA